MEFSWIIVLGAVGISVACGAGTSWFLIQRYVQRMKKDDLAAKAREPLAYELRVFKGALHRQGIRLQALERQMQGVIDRQNRLDMRAPSGERFKHAIALVQRGASADEIMSTCGLAREEAQLMCLLHRSGSVEPGGSNPRHSGRAGTP